MGLYNTFKLEWRAPVYEDGLPECGHDVPDGANFCPECGMPLGDEMPDEAIARYIRHHSEMSRAVLENGDACEGAKWYNYREDMKAMSRHFTGILFTLSGGNERDGAWKLNFLNGDFGIAD